MLNPRSLLTNDHASLGKLLRRVQAALRESNFKAAHAKLDLFWARLAVHIRGEHLHLFPAVLTAIKNGRANQLSGPSPAQVESDVAALRSDHDFFMQELAKTVTLLRTLAADSESPSDATPRVRESIRTVESRLKRHNQTEETRVYHWTSTILNEAQQVELAGKIRREFMKRPKRFSVDEWGEAV